MSAAAGESERPARPTEYAKGQRWNWRDVPRWTHITLTRPSPNGWYALNDRGNEDGHFGWSMLEECTYLGGPSPAVPQEGPARPKAGERWILGHCGCVGVTTGIEDRGFGGYGPGYRLQEEFACTTRPNTNHVLLAMGSSGAFARLRA
jgi:hypothetical protein